MARILTATDVEKAAQQGQTLALAKGDRLTPLAHDRAKELGVNITTGASATTASTAVAPPAATPAPAPKPVFTPATATSAGTGKPIALPPSGALYRRHALGPQTAASTHSTPNHQLPKAGVVGAGHVGAIAALRLAQSGLFSEVVMVDVVEGLAEGLALDMWHGASVYGFATRVSGSTDLAALAECDYIIITAGKPRQPGMTRTDLTAVNAAIMQSVATAIKQYAPQSTLVVVSNPLEEMTHLAARYTGFPQERVLGMAGVLDSARFCALVGLTGVATPRQVHALALGSHGPEMVIPLSLATANGRPIEQVLDATTLAAIVERTRESGGEVVKLLKKGSAYFSPGESAAHMVRVMAQGSNEVLAACVRSGGAYGTTDARVGLPVRLGRQGLKEIITLALKPAEQQALQEAAARIAARIAELPAN